MNLYKPLHARLCRYVQSLIWQPDDAKDLISEVTLQAYENFERIKQPDQFVYYLFGIARNLFLKKLRRQKFQLPWNDVVMQQLAGSEHAEALVQQKELANLLAQLKPAQQEALTLFEVAGFSYEEIAGIQQTALSNVKAHIYKARQTMKAVMEKEERRVQHVEKMEEASRLKAGGLQ
ncbi:MAG: RNA polymerase sigma factor [Bacteroidia bacterium]|nr:RNA polymerase sigma factor [Bacteroidia bacterium]